MKKTENIQVRLSDGGRINMRVTPEEKQMIKSIAEANNSTMSAVIRRALDNVDKPINVNLDETDLRDLIIQVRRINNNVRSFLNNISFSEHYTLEDRREIEKQLVKNEEAVLGEREHVRDTVLKLENLSTEEAAELARKVKDKNLQSLDEINDQL